MIWDCYLFYRWPDEIQSVIQVPIVEVDAAEITNEYVECIPRDIILVDMKDLNQKDAQQIHYCVTCKLTYHGSVELFEKHMSTHTSSNHELKNFSNKTSMCEEVEENERHQIKEEQTVEKFVAKKKSALTCHQCNNVFLKKLHLKLHMRNHCEENGTDSDEEQLLHNSRQMADNRVSYRCNECGKSIFTKRGFLRHIRVHSGRRPCECHVCGEHYRIKQDLVRHIRDVHEGVKKYVCDICSRAFANKGARDDHRRIHTGERPYACEHCPKTFRTLNSIYVHNRMHTNYRPHACSYCNKRFRNKQILNNHITTHTGIRAFPCDVCGKTFSVKSEMTRHRVTHNQEKPFKCESCMMKFNQKRYLRNHIRQHHKNESSILLALLDGK